MSNLLKAAKAVLARCLCCDDGYEDEECTCTSYNERLEDLRAAIRTEEEKTIQYDAITEANRRAVAEVFPEEAAQEEPITLAKCRGLAAQAWCTPETSGIEMDARLAEAFAQILRRRSAPAEAEEVLKLFEEIKGALDDGIADSDDGGLYARIAISYAALLSTKITVALHALRPKRKEGGS